MRTLEEKLALPIVRLDIGSGDHNIKLPADEWIHLDGCPGKNVDLVCDFSKIELPDECVDEAWSGDTIEHILSYELPSILKEWNRVIKIGGSFSGQTPNAHNIMMQYAEKYNAGIEDKDLIFKTALEGLYGWHTDKWQQHYITYSTKTLTKVLEDHGFGNVIFPQTPGSTPDKPENSWWLCFSATKIKNI